MRSTDYVPRRREAPPPRLAPQTVSAWCVAASTAPRAAAQSDQRLAAAATASARPAGRARCPAGRGDSVRENLADAALPLPPSPARSAVAAAGGQLAAGGRSGRAGRQARRRRAKGGECPRQKWTTPRRSRALLRLAPRPLARTLRRAAPVKAQTAASAARALAGRSGVPLAAGTSLLRRGRAMPAVGALRCCWRCPPSLRRRRLRRLRRSARPRSARAGGARPRVVVPTAARCQCGTAPSGTFVGESWPILRTRTKGKGRALETGPAPKRL